MKRTRLKPGKALRGTKRLVRRGTLQRVGKRKAREIEQFSEFRRNWLKENPWCEVCPILATIGIVLVPKPLHRADGIHERCKRSSGGSLTDPANLMASCNIANGFIETIPVKARRLGLTVRAWEDPAKVDIAKGNVVDWKNHG